MRVINYQGLQHKIVPCIATSFLISFVVHDLRSLNYEYLSLLDSSKGEDPVLFPKLAKLHMLTAIFKSQCTWYARHFGELMKQGTGGHGYMNISGLTKPHMDFAIGVATAEGDGVVLTQQTSKSLIKLVEQGELDTETSLFDNKVNNMTLEESLLYFYEKRFKGQLKHAIEKANSLKK